MPVRVRPSSLPVVRTDDQRATDSSLAGRDSFLHQRIKALEKQVSELGRFKDRSTDMLAEGGSNQYFTPERVRASLFGLYPIQLDSRSGAIRLKLTAEPPLVYLDATGVLTIDTGLVTFEDDGINVGYTGAVYFGPLDVDGSWRMKVDDGQLVRQQRIGGVWVTIPYLES